MVEKLGRNDSCLCGSGRRFPPLLPYRRPFRRRSSWLLRPRPSHLKTRPGLVSLGAQEATRDARRFRPGHRVFGSTMRPDVPVGGGLYDQLIGAVIKQNIAALMGTYAEYKCLPEASLITQMPSGATYQEAGAIPYWAGLALHFWRKAGAGKGPEGSRLWRVRRRWLLCCATGQAFRRGGDRGLQHAQS
jgi:hypothetical protein